MAGRLEQLGTDVAALVRSVSWTGADYERFRDHAELTTARLSRVVDSVRVAADDLHAHAEEQDLASEPDSYGIDDMREIARFDLESLVLRMSGGDELASEALRQLFGKEGKSTPEDLGGFLDPDEVDSRSIEVDDIEDFSLEGDLSQGRLGDCWFLASLAAVAATAPETIEDRITLVEGATPDEDFWEVELWDGTEWVTHVVTQDEIVRHGVRDDNGDITWMTIYERAAVEHMGGEYGDIERNFAGKGFDMVTGDNGSMSIDLSLDTIEAKLQEGQSVVTSTPPAIPFLGPADDVVPGHVYVVDEIIRPTDGSEPRIRLINPWGDPTASRPPVLELTQSEYTRSFISHNSVAP